MIGTASFFSIVIREGVLLDYGRRNFSLLPPQGIGTLPAEHTLIARHGLGLCLPAN